MELKYFDLSANNLTIVTGELFEFMPKLISLNMSRNGLEEVDTNAMKDLEHLRSLDLSFNRLSHDSFLWPIAELRYLNLSHNQYMRVNMSIFHNVIYAEMYDNPFDCQWLINEMAHLSSDGAIAFGRSYIVTHNKGVLSVPGIQCYDMDGTKRDLIVLDTEKAKEELTKVGRVNL